MASLRGLIVKLGFQSPGFFLGSAKRRCILRDATGGETPHTGDSVIVESGRPGTTFGLLFRTVIGPLMESRTLPSC